MEVKILIDWKQYDIWELSIEVSDILIKMLSIKKQASKIYKEASFNKTKDYVRTWEFRPPLKGEYYLSWARAEVYKAFDNLSTPFHIAKLITN